MNKQLRILIVDDEESLRDLIRKILTRNGFEVVEASSGNDALEILKNSAVEYDVVLLDVIMPGMSGFDVLHAIKGNPETAPLKVIMLTAMASAQDKVMAFSAGANDYLVKPIDKNELVARIKTHAEFKQTERALYESQKCFQQIAEHSPFPILIHSPDGKNEYLNHQFSKLFGYTIDDIPTTQEWFELAFPDIEYRTEVISAWESDERSISNHGIEHIKREFDVACGDTSAKTVTVRTIRMDDGKYYRVFHDITESRHMVQSLSESEERFKEMADLLPQSVFELDLSGRLTFINNHGFESTGYTYEDFESGMNALQMFIPEDRERILKNIAKRLEGADFSDHEYTVLRKNGTTFPVLLYSSPILHDETPIGIRGIALDISERKQAEEDLRERESFNFALFQHIPVPTTIVDLEGKVVRSNLAKVNSGERLPEIGELMYVDFTIDSDINMRAILMDSIESAEVHKLPELNIRDRFHSVTISPFTQGAMIMEEDITHRKQSENALREAHDLLEQHVKERTTELKQANELLLQEITERKKSEVKLIDANQHLQIALDKLNASQEQLLQSAKLAAIGELISGISHELKNPLAAISMASEILDSKIDDEKSKKHIQIVSDHAQRAVTIVNNLLSFARKYEPNRSLVSINDAVQSTLNLLSYELKRDKIELDTKLDPDIPNTMADFNQLQHVFLNLFGNADQAMHEARGGGKLLVQTHQYNGTIQITITDDGPGIPEEIKDRIFEPFFTTKEVGKGTGLGLSICYGIIEQHEGRIYVESNEGEGTTFTVELPVIHEAIVCTI